ncbi:hypothetical protein Pmar_PMAR024561 [Perkinsus marinus ATCC 50983]|uniref:Uncharacterized protein n=1 Tax=Perkinsus marinus (strain ATCC 50983 / TXsc) TaxID=423536 RepID=C5LTB6_PERM5|nr:hypothetical protein Pmar_PMAR024561 [Perkinsus marinus ATCC 50983]EER00084.1 hypothetical protein Pmar_PMAR024561 [Perkinsus marinus ATCC 50983]|eukprot:XP_002767366.1 hypothetical protein Pmar_PMAR024561 [Perkinsus marinus ATCC 50983]
MPSSLRNDASALPLFAVVPFLQSSEAVSLYAAFKEPVEFMPLVHVVDTTIGPSSIAWQSLQLLQTLSIEESHLAIFNYSTLPSLTTITIRPSEGCGPELDLCPVLGRFLTPKLRIMNLKGFCCDTIARAIGSVEEWPIVEKVFISHNGASCCGSVLDIWEAISLAFPALRGISAVPWGHPVNGQCQLTIAKRQVEFMPFVTEVELKGLPPVLLTGPSHFSRCLTSLSLTGCLVSATLLGCLSTAGPLSSLKRLSLIGPFFGAVGSLLALRLTEEGVFPALERLSLNLTKFQGGWMGDYTDLGVSFLRILIKLYQSHRISPHRRLQVITTTTIGIPEDTSLIYQQLIQGPLPAMKVLKLKSDDGRYRIIDFLHATTTKAF